MTTDHVKPDVYFGTELLEQPLVPFPVQPPVQNTVQQTGQNTGQNTENTVQNTVNDGPVITDADGVLFDPSIHCLTADGVPVKTKHGRFRKKANYDRDRAAQFSPNSAPISAPEKLPEIGEVRESAKVIVQAVFETID